MLVESICHFRGAGLILSFSYFDKVDPDQTLHIVGSDLGLYCLIMTLLRVSQ